MMALQQKNNEIIKRRLDKFKEDGINTYFVDCHGMLELSDDYSKEHEQTIFQDAQIKISHLNYISKQSLVLGSETATTNTIPYLAFSHGNFSNLCAAHYRSMQNKDIYGGWYPTECPNIFFKPLSNNQQRALFYDHKYRLPLFQAVFHDCIITTDRWDAPITKYPELIVQRLMLEFLYGVPSILSLDIQRLIYNKKLLCFIAQEFYEFHTKIMTMQLTHFSYLTNDKNVQKTVFGKDEVSIIGNFSDTFYDDIPQKSLKITYNNTAHTILDFKTLL